MDLRLARAIELAHAAQAENRRSNPCRACTTRRYCVSGWDGRIRIFHAQPFKPSAMASCEEIRRC